jgi:hypothetical protein
MLIAIQQPIVLDQLNTEELEIQKCIKLEAGWIMTNLAYGDETELKNLLSFKLDNGMSILSFVKNIF